jgi:hypothetical protein
VDDIWCQSRAAGFPKRATNENELCEGTVCIYRYACNSALSYLSVPLSSGTGGAAGAAMQAMRRLCDSDPTANLSLGSSLLKLPSDPTDHTVIAFAAK